QRLADALVDGARAVGGIDGGADVADPEPHPEQLAVGHDYAQAEEQPDARGPGPQRVADSVAHAATSNGGKSSSISTVALPKRRPWSARRTASGFASRMTHFG